jgi:lysozyme
MDDENLFLALNTPVKTSERPPKFIMQQLNAFVAKGLQEVGEEIEVPFPEAGLPAEEDLAEAPEADETATALLETPPSEAAPEVIEGGAGEALEEKPIEAAPDLEGEIEQTIRSDEGSDLTVRKDGKSGKLVVGTGHQVAPADNLKEGDTISKERAEGLLQTDLSQAKTEAETILNTLGEQPPELTGLITEMTFQLGLEGTQKFQKFLDALRRQDYEAAADEIVDSKLFREDSPERAQRLADRVRALAQPQSP